MIWCSLIRLTQYYASYCTCNPERGCGKSTLALSLAVAARDVNRRTLILDTDPQRTVSTWWQDREQDTPDCVEVFESTALPKALDLAKQKKFDLVFINWLRVLLIGITS